MYTHRIKKLLAIENLTLAKAVIIAQGEEAEDRNSQVLKRTEPTVNEVNEVASHKACGHCGWTSHDQKDCYYVNATCYNCGKCGHIAEVCRSGKIPRPRQVSPRARPSPKNLNMREARKPQYSTK